MGRLKTYNIYLPVVPGRMGMLVTLLLVIVNMFIWTLSSLPASPTLTNTEYWFIYSGVQVTSRSFSISTLIGLTFTIVEEVILVIVEYFVLLLLKALGGAKVEQQGIHKQEDNLRKLTKKIDMTSLIFFPLLSAVINVIFWVPYF